MNFNFPKFSRKSWLFLFLGAMVAVIPFTVLELQQQQNVRQQAATSQNPLPWKSGAAIDNGIMKDFETWRGKNLDYYMTWPNNTSWDEIRNPDIYGQISQYKDLPGILQVGIAMIPDNGSGNFATCATGAYDQYYKDIGTKLVQLNRGNSVINLGWEANGDWFKWSIGSGDPTDYISCFRKEATAIKSTAPNIKIAWDMNKESHMGSKSVLDAYPGDNYVDIIGVDYYDFFSVMNTQEAWDAQYMKTQNGGPLGIGAWLQFARCHGKKLSFPEWGINKGADGGGMDDPFYIEKMYEFFYTNASNIAYETYFNLEGDTFQIYPTNFNPNAGAKYKALWSAGPNMTTQEPTSTLFCASPSPTTPIEESPTPSVCTATPAPVQNVHIDCPNCKLGQ